MVTGTTISSSWANSTLNDIATALSTCLLKDGTQTATASVPFGAGLTATTVTTTGIISVDDTTESTSTVTGSIHTDGGLGVAKALYVGGVTTHGGNVVSDTDSTDSLGTTSVRWLTAFVDDLTITTSIELGHDTDTTITRAAAGKIAVEGDTVGMLATAQIWTASQRHIPTTLSSASNVISWNAATALYVHTTLTENTTVSAPSNLVTGMHYILRITQGTATGYSVAYNAVFNFPGGSAPTTTTTVNAVDQHTYYCPDGSAMDMVGIVQDIS